MKGTGKLTTTIMLVVMFILGVVILFISPDRMAAYIQLLQYILWPLLVVMCGVAGKSIAKVIKGEKKISDINIEGE